MIAVVDYGMGNLRSVTNAFRHLAVDVTVTRDHAAIREAQALVVPGVGAFGRCIENLERFGLFDLIREHIAAGKRYLGICLGMQILFESSEESPGAQGLGVIKGRVMRFRGPLKIPHMGWNGVNIVKHSALFDGIENNSYFYFVHSYFPVTDEEAVSATTTEYGTTFTSSVERGNVFASQFHPEKSQKVGLDLLRNFVRLCG